MRDADPGRDMIALGLKAKGEGNEKFKAGKYRGAVTDYTQAIDEFQDYVDGNMDFEAVKAARVEKKEAVSETEAKVLKDCAICYANRAFCNIKLENYGSATIDAERGIELEPTYAKSYYRLGSAKYALTKYKDALKAFKSLCKLAPNDKDARLKLKECDKVSLCYCFVISLLEVVRI